VFVVRSTRRPSWLDSQILGLLCRREMHGYEIAQAIRLEPAATAGASACFREGGVYPALRRLERDGLLAAHWIEIGEKVPRRRYYSLTPRGAEAAEPRHMSGLLPRSKGARP
jgi:PadR family transcriptional regulator PadR